MLVNAGTHGDEYEGIIAIHEMFRRLAPDDLQGTFLAIPILSPPAVTGGQRNGLWDDRNLARAFPGEPEGLFFVWLYPALATIIAVNTGVQTGFVASLVMLALCLRRTLGSAGTEDRRPAD